MYKYKSNFSRFLHKHPHTQGSEDTLPKGYSTVVEQEIALAEHSTGAAHMDLLTEVNLFII